MVKKIIIIAVIIAVIAGLAVWYFTRPPKEPEPSSYSPGEYFITNIQESNKLFRTDIILRLSRDDQLEFLEENNYIIRDIILFTLRDKTEEELRAAGAQQGLRDEIISSLKDKLGIDYITAIYFNEYIIQ